MINLYSLKEEDYSGFGRQAPSKPLYVLRLSVLRPTSVSKTDVGCSSKQFYFNLLMPTQKKKQILMAASAAGRANQRRSRGYNRYLREREIVTVVRRDSWRIVPSHIEGTVIAIAFKKNPSLVRAPSALKTILFLNCFEGAWRPNLLQSFS